MRYSVVIILGILVVSPLTANGAGAPISLCTDPDYQGSGLYHRNCGSSRTPYLVPAFSDYDAIRKHLAVQIPELSGLIKVDDLKSPVGLDDASVDGLITEIRQRLLRTQFRYERIAELRAQQVAEMTRLVTKARDVHEHQSSGLDANAVPEQYLLVQQSLDRLAQKVVDLDRSAILAKRRTDAAQEMWRAYRKDTVQVMRAYGPPNSALDLLDKAVSLPVEPRNAVITSTSIIPAESEPPPARFPGEADKTSIDERFQSLIGSIPEPRLSGSQFFEIGDRLKELVSLAQASQSAHDRAAVREAEVKALSNQFDSFIPALRLAEAAPSFSDVARLQREVRRLQNVIQHKEVELKTEQRKALFATSKAVTWLMFLDNQVLPTVLDTYVAAARSPRSEGITHLLAQARNAGSTGHFIGSWDQYGRAAEYSVMVSTAISIENSQLFFGADSAKILANGPVSGAYAIIQKLWGNEDVDGVSVFRDTLVNADGQSGVAVAWQRFAAGSQVKAVPAEYLPVMY